MTNKEKFKRAFSAIHTSENFRIRLENLIKHEKIKAYCIPSESTPIGKKDDEENKAQRWPSK